MTMKHLLPTLCSAILLAAPLMLLPGQANAQQSRQAQIDLLEVRALDALESGRYGEFLEILEDLRDLEVEPGTDVLYFEARALMRHANDYARAAPLLLDFLEQVPSRHPHYQDALMLLSEAQGQGEVPGHIQIEMLEVRALEALRAERFAAFVGYLDRIRDLDGDPGADALYYEGVAYHEHLNDLDRAEAALTAFVDRADGDHRYYRQGLRRLATVQRELETRLAEEVPLYQAAVDDSTPDAARAYLERFPDGRYADEVRTLLDDRLFARAVAANTSEAYEVYLAEMGDGGRHASPARATAKALAREERLAFLDRREKRLSASFAEARRNQAQFLTGGALAVGVGVSGFGLMYLRYSASDGPLHARIEERYPFLLSDLVAGSMLIVGIVGIVLIPNGVEHGQRRARLRRRLDAVREEAASLRTAVLVPVVDPVGQHYALALRVSF